MYLLLLNGAGGNSGARTESVTNVGVKDVVGMVNNDRYPIVSCPYLNLGKNSTFDQEGAQLSRQIFVSKLLSNDTMQPTRKQQRNSNMKCKMQRFIYAI